MRESGEMRDDGGKERCRMGKWEWEVDVGRRCEGGERGGQEMGEGGGDRRVMGQGGGEGMRGRKKGGQIVLNR